MKWILATLAGAFALGLGIGFSARRSKRVRARIWQLLWTPRG